MSIIRLVQSLPWNVPGFLGDTLPTTNSEFTPENGWLEDDPFLLKWSIFRGKLAVSFREGSFFQDSVFVGNL